MRPPDRNTRRTTILDTYIRGIAEHYATDPAYAPNIFELAHGPQYTPQSWKRVSGRQMRHEALMSDSCAGNPDSGSVALYPLVGR